MFDFLKPKTSIRLDLNVSEVSLGGMVSGKVTILPNENFVSNSLTIYLMPESLSFHSDIPFTTEIKIQESMSYVAGLETVVGFECPCTTLKDMDGWFGTYTASLPFQDRTSPLYNPLLNFESFLQKAVEAEWIVQAYFDIPGFDAKDEKYVDVRR